MMKFNKYKSKFIFPFYTAFFRVFVYFGNHNCISRMFR